MAHRAAEEARVEEALEVARLMHSEPIHLSREERDHVAGHALDSIKALAEELAWSIGSEGIAQGAASNCSRKIAALSNLLGDIGWEREAVFPDSEDPQLDVAEGEASWHLGELFPVAQLRPWLEEWQRQDGEALAEADRALEILKLDRKEAVREEGEAQQAIAAAQTKLGTGAILLARIEKRMASHEN